MRSDDQVRLKPSVVKLHKKHVRRQIVVDHEGNLLHINPPSPHVCGDQHAAVKKSGRGGVGVAKLAKSLGEDVLKRNSRSSPAKLAHNGVSLLLDHFTVHSGNRKVRNAHFFCQPVDLYRSARQ